MKILNKDVDDSIFDELIIEITKKKEISGIDKNIVKDILIQELSKNSKKVELVMLNKKSVKKEFIKSVRSILHHMHGSFNIENKKKCELFLKKYNESNDVGYIEDLLSMHKSTNERLKIYRELYSQIFEITGSPNSIIEFGCGFNPFSIIYFPNFPFKKKLNYLASDISNVELGLINKFFDNSNNKISGLTKIINLFDAKNKDLEVSEMFKEFSNYDICFLFKVLDSIELSKNHKLSEIILTNLQMKWIVVSFSTKTVSGKKMNFPSRGWFERMVARLGYSYTKLEYYNEVFYVVKKNL